MGNMQKSELASRLGTTIPTVLAFGILGAAVLGGCARSEVKAVSSRTVLNNESAPTSVIDTKIAQYQDLAKEFPDEPKYQERLSGLYREKDDFKKALYHIGKARKIDPKNPKYDYHEGQIYIGIGNFARAEKAYLRMVENSPEGKFTGPHFELAKLYMMDDRPVEAEAALMRCLKIDDKFSLPHYHLAQIARFNKDKKKAIHHYEEYLRLDGQLYREQALRMLYNLQPDLDPNRKKQS